MKKVLLLMIITAISLLTYINASFVVGNYSIDNFYSPNQDLSGYINISFKNESINTTIKAFDQNISILEFLKNNEVSYNCTTKDCNAGFILDGSGSSTKSYALNYNKRVFGIKLTGSVGDINNFSFRLTSDVQESCLLPLKLDLLNDDSIDWSSNSMSTNTCGMNKPYGCYKEIDYEDFTPLTQSYTYCEVVSLSPSKGYRVGAEVIGSGSAKFRFFTNIGGDAECIVETVSGGEIGCNFALEEPLINITETEVCFEVQELDSEYKIKYEDVNPCGFIDDGSERFNHDFKIFAYPLKYSGIAELNVNQDLMDNMTNGVVLTDMIKGYIDEHYEGNCTPCIIPMSVYGIPQTLQLSDLMVEYHVGGITKKETNFYNLKESQVKVSTPFQILDIDKADINVPGTVGSKKFTMYIGNTAIFTKNISVQSGVGIIDILPHDPPSLVNIDFVALIDSNRTDLTYKWKFGNDPEITTSTNTIKHTFVSTGDSQVKLTVYKDNSEYTKTVGLTVIAPKNYINTTIAELRENLRNVEYSLGFLDSQLKQEAIQKVDVETMRLELNKQDNLYKDASSDEQYTQIMQTLINMKIPNKFAESQVIPSMPLIIDNTQISPDVLADLGAGESSDYDKEESFKPLFNWINKKLDAKIESKTYSSYYRGGEDEVVLFSDIHLKLKPKSEDTLGEIYIVIRGDPNKIKVLGDYNPKDIEGEGIGIVIDELMEEKDIQILYPDKLDLLKLPIYLSPNFDEYVGVTDNPGSKNCNNNRICEKEKGENTTNCKNDCKPISTMLILLCVLIVIAFVIYILMQEWYKRYYETTLFKDKNQLFNLINFMNNSENQGLKKLDIINKLKSYNWSNEQLDFAWKKLHGERTGMWEIPLFNLLQKAKVKSEIKKLNQDPKNNNSSNTQKK